MTTHGVSLLCRFQAPRRERIAKHRPRTPDTRATRKSDWWSSACNGFAWLNKELDWKRLNESHGKQLNLALVRDALQSEPILAGCSTLARAAVLVREL